MTDKPMGVVEVAAHIKQKYSGKSNVLFYEVERRLEECFEQIRDEISGLDSNSCDNNFLRRDIFTLKAFIESKGLLEELTEFVEQIKENLLLMSTIE